MIINSLKIRTIFRPTAIILISFFFYMLLSKRLEADIHDNSIPFLFSCLFIYWLAVIIFNVHGFMKNRVIVGKR
jgi:hypothetical protein